MDRMHLSPAAGDFLAVLKHRRLISDIPSGPANRSEFKETVATTILGFKFAGGVLVAGDRRATAGNIVMYDRADKVLEIDRHSVMAIAGSPATAWEMARILEHSFQFYRRSQLQEMSVEGKVRALSKLLRDNLGMVMQGVGVVVPLFATYDKKSSDPAKLFFYDAMGAQFEATDFASSGSGAAAVRSVLYYEKNWGSKPLAGTHAGRGHPAGAESVGHRCRSGHRDRRNRSSRQNFSNHQNRE